MSVVLDLLSYIASHKCMISLWCRCGVDSRDMRWAFSTTCTAGTLITLAVFHSKVSTESISHSMRQGGIGSLEFKG